MKTNLLLVLLVLFGFEKLFSQNDYPSPRKGTTLIKIDTAFYMFGGEVPNSKKLLFNDLRKYDPERNHWLQDPPANNPPSPRSYHSAVAYNGKMYVYGGYTNSGISNELWEYDPSSRMWSQKAITGASIPERFQHSAVLSGNYMYIVGGNNGQNILADGYKIDLNTFNATQMPLFMGGAPATNGMAATSLNNNVYFFGGNNNIGSSNQIVYYNTQYNYYSFPNSGGFQFGFGFAGAANASNNEAFIAGGSSSSKSLLHSIYKYNATTEQKILITNNIPAGEYFNVFIMHIDSISGKNFDTSFYFWGLIDYATFYKYDLATELTTQFDTISNSWITVQISSNNCDNNYFSIFPNPANEVIKIITNKTEFKIELINIFGQIVLNDYNTAEINVNGLAPGIYFLKISGNNFTKQEKIVIN